MNAGDLVRVRAGPAKGAKSLWAGELALVVRKVPFYEMQGQCGDPYAPWWEVLLCDNGKLKLFQEDYLRKCYHGNR